MDCYRQNKLYSEEIESQRALLGSHHHSLPLGTHKRANYPDGDSASDYGFGILIISPELCLLFPDATHLLIV